MKFSATAWLMPAAFSFLITGGGEPIPQEPSQPDRCSTAKFYFNLEGAFASLRWDKPARFPNPAGYGVERDEFAIDCPDFSATADHARFTMRGSSFAVIEERVFMPDVLHVSGYRYPAVKVDAYSYSVRLVLAPDSVSLESGYNAGLGTVFRKAVVAARVDGGDLQPVLFEARITPITIRRAGVVDMFVKDDENPMHVKIARVTLDLKSNSLTLYKKFPFPHK